MLHKISLFALALLAGTADAFLKPALISTQQSRQQIGINGQQQQQQPHVTIDAAVSKLSTAERRSQHVLFMGWGPDPIWSEAEIITNESANKSGKSVSITVTVPATAPEEYKIPGQYVQLRLNEDTKPLFLAIASAPDASSNVFEFLIKKTDDNDWITGAAAGTKVEVSQVLGGGFPMEENLDGFKYDFPTQNVLLFCVGSGIAPIKAAMESDALGIAKPGSGGRTCRLYYGVQHPDDLCFLDKYEEWESNGFEIVPVMSQPPEGWNGRTGYVQNVLEEDGVPIPRNSGALLCGTKGMAESVKDILTKAGMFEGRVLTNF
eukprot:CAMPEP_0198109830 /NCGR_PEP_ID=MMETSP1442-20131203/1877_1 /TAXON_ID= /ORGANISM="Craspedostauros australis, Strain CCMP3328" /LENGTH=319 /DNA_ID=CAMNT_0043765641 /DNA_START=69 /DNA_END=1028 /DNA_ORIENTATION=+